MTPTTFLRNVTGKMSKGLEEGFIAVTVSVRVCEEMGLKWLRVVR